MSVLKKSIKIGNKKIDGYYYGAAIISLKIISVMRYIHLYLIINFIV